MHARSFLFFSALLGIAASFLCAVKPALAQTTYYFCVNGGTGGSGVTNGATYNWLSDPNWSTDPTGSSPTFAAPFNYEAGDNAVFVAGSDAGSNAFTVTVNGFMGVQNVNVNSGNVFIDVNQQNWTLSGDGGNNGNDRGTATWTVPVGTSLTVGGAIPGYSSWAR